MEEYNLNPTIQLPPQLSTFAPEIDRIYYFIYWVSVVFFVGIVGAMVYFLWKYRRRAGSKSSPTGHNNALELFWTFSPLILLFIMFHWGFQVYMHTAVAPDDAMNIQVTASRWKWEFLSPEGSPSNNEVYVPVGRPVRLVMSSQDVLHSFFVPDFRVKRDVVPGMFSSLWFQAVDRPDENPNDNELYSVQVFCTEYCGTGHSDMMATIHVLNAAQYAAFVQQGPPPPPGLTPAQWGGQLFGTNCAVCHSREPGVINNYPNFHNLWGRQERLADGTTVTVNEEYVRESILNPGAKVVNGFTPAMPNFHFPDSQLNALVEYLKTLHE